MTDVREKGLEALRELLPDVFPDVEADLQNGEFGSELVELTLDNVFGRLGPRGLGPAVMKPGDPRRSHCASRDERADGPLSDRPAQRTHRRRDRRGDLPLQRLRGLSGGELCAGDREGGPRRVVRASARSCRRRSQKTRTWPSRAGTVAGSL